MAKVKQRDQLATLIRIVGRLEAGLSSPVWRPIQIVVDVPGGPNVISVPILHDRPTVIDLPALGYEVRRTADIP